MAFDVIADIHQRLMACVDAVRAATDQKVLLVPALGGSLPLSLFTENLAAPALILPIAKSFGIDPYHLAMIYLINLELGYLTPPVGLNLFLASYRFEKPVLTVARSALPFFFILLVVLLLVTYVPFLTTGIFPP